ncbi:KilA-N domain-containing protein [Methylococcus sp. EFPC2]|uniref:KilA-N domain-containing protein n=1 Tax=Methylococcus sp. EFPC2 TaxID=2812648 RepID=UPI0019677EEC|nr:KilA-N domain-containing protein [Methylococcus sp. EFPC2]QSA97124.1 KilA-N domain-containing protein [Methylococcus sp. EFPC2]
MIGASNIIALDYQGHEIGFAETGWFNATEAAAGFGKRPVDWLALDSTQDYIATLAEISKCEKSSLLKTKRGRHHGGTWMHPKLAVPFARWLDTRFAIWCDLQIDALVRGTHQAYDWQKARSAATSSFKVMAEVLRLVRQDQGKATETRHYINETRVVNWALSGEFKALDRESLAPCDLALLASLEERNAVWLGRGVAYADRKKILEQHALDWRSGQQPKIERAA